MVSHCACPFVLFFPVQCSAKQGGEEVLIAAVEPNSPLLQTSTKGSGRGCPSLRASSDHSFIVGALRARRAPDRSLLLPSSLVISQGWGLIDLPLRASNEGLLRPRVARAQKIIRLHPLSLIGDHPWRLEAAETVLPERGRVLVKDTNRIWRQDPPRAHKHLSFQLPRSP
jgi:hypothetical protein